MVDAEFAPDALFRLARCQVFWQSRGYQAVSLPWITALAYTEATRPAGGTEQPPLGPGYLVASGEQSFLQLADRGQLPPAKGYVGWSPCVRQEAGFDATHHLYFLKVELFVPAAGPEALLAVKEMLLGSVDFNAKELLASGHGLEGLEVCDVAPNQWDIQLAGIELGSYGLRQHFGIDYVYGTGCAEPRFTQALQTLQRVAG